MRRTLVIVLALCFGTVGSPVEPPSAQRRAAKEFEGQIWLEPDVVAIISADDVLSALEETRDRLKAEPLYLKLSYAPYLLERLKSTEKCETQEYERSPADHDLNCIAGRAAWILEGAFDIAIPAIEASSTQGERENSHRLAARQLDAFERGVTQAVQQYRVGDHKTALKHKYQRRILEGSPEEHGPLFTIQAVHPMNAMLEEWFPLGKRLADLEAIIGRKAWSYHRKRRDDESSEHVSGVFEYKCDSGFHGTAYYLLVREGVIEAMNQMN